MRKMELKDITQQPTKHFIKFINRVYLSDPVKYTNLVKTYFDATIKDGFVIKERDPSMLEVAIERQYNKIKGHEKLESGIDAMDFIRFKYLPLNKFAKSYVMHYLTGEYMENYNNGTTPCRYVDDEDYFSITEAKPFNDDLLYTFKIMARNSIFTPTDIKLFSDKYIETLFARTRHTKHLFNTEDLCKAQSNSAFSQNRWVYDKMQGMYYFDAQVLFYMATEFRKRNLDLSNIQNAFQSLPFEEDLGNEDPDYNKKYYIPLYKQKDYFDMWKESLDSLLVNTQELLEHDQQKLQVKKKLLGILKKSKQNNVEDEQFK